MLTFGEYLTEVIIPSTATASASPPPAAGAAGTGMPKKNFPPNSSARFKTFGQRNRVKMSLPATPRSKSGFQYKGPGPASVAWHPEKQEWRAESGARFGKNEQHRAARHLVNVGKHPNYEHAHAALEAARAPSDAARALARDKAIGKYAAGAAVTGIGLGAYKGLSWFKHGWPGF